MLHPGECGRVCAVHFREEILLTSPRNGAAPRRFPRYQPNVLTHSLNKASQRNLGGFVRSRGLSAPRPGGARVHWDIPR